jgi:hypothetical protein
MPWDRGFVLSLFSKAVFRLVKNQILHAGTKILAAPRLVSVPLTEAECARAAECASDTECASATTLPSAPAPLLPSALAPLLLPSAPANGGKGRSSQRAGERTSQLLLWWGGQLW